MEFDGILHRRQHIFVAHHDDRRHRDRRQCGPAVRATQDRLLLTNERLATNACGHRLDLLRHRAINMAGVNQLRQQPIRDAQEAA